MNEAPSLQIGERRIGPGQPCLVVAEVSANHNGSLSRAIDIIRAARVAGADAIKLQTYTSDTMTIDSDEAWFRVPASTLWAGRTLYDLYAEAYTPWEWHAELFRVAHEEGLICFSTPFDASAVGFLEELGAPAYKIASFELIDVPLLRAIGQTKKPVILSTGMATFAEIREAVAVLRQAGASGIALLKCTSAYPAPPESMNLRTIPYLQEAFGVVAGLSDHTMGGAVAVAATTLGASIIEKHFTLRRADGGPDSAFSMEPIEFKQMVADVRQAEAAIGGVCFERSRDEQTTRTFRRSLFVVRNVSEGEVFTEQNVRSIRPGFGLPPRELPNIIGRCAVTKIQRGTPLTWKVVGDRQPGQLRIRPVDADDCDLLFTWVNDPEVRRLSLDSSTIAYEAHVEWFQRHYRSDRCFMFVVSDEKDEPVGQVRFDLHGEDEARIDLSVDCRHRGRGHAANAFFLGLDALRRAAPYVKEIVDYVRPENTFSRRFLARTGFVECRPLIFKNQEVIEVRRAISESLAQ